MAMYVSDTDPVLKRLNKQGEAGKSKTSSAPATKSSAYVSDTDPVLRRLSIMEGNAPTKADVISTKYSDPLIETARGGKITSPTVNIPNLNINAFGANMNAGKRAGDVLGAAVTGGIGNAAEALGQVTQSTGLTIGEQLRLAAQGKTTQADTVAAEKEKAERTDARKEKLYGFSDKMQAQSQQYTEAAKEGLGKVGQFAVDASIMGTQLAGDILLGAINPALGTAAMATRAFGGSAQQARQAGATETEQQLYGAASAATSVLVEKIAQVGKLFKGAYGGSIAGGSVDDILNKVIGKAVKNPTLQRIIGSAIGEGGEEALEAIIQPALQAIYDKGETLNKTWFTDNGEEAKEYLSEIGYNALLGGALGAVGAGGNANAPANAQNTPPNAVASRTEPTEGNNAHAPQNGTGASVGANEPIYNWGIKKDATLGGGGAIDNSAALASDASSVASNSKPNVTPPAQNVKRDVFAEDVRSRAQNPSVGAADAGFDQFSALENKYGAIDGKARSIRPDDVPRSITGEDRVSETISTVKGAAATPDDFVPILETEAMKGEFSFMPITNNETVQAAVRKIREEGFPKALENWRKSVHGGRVSQNTVVIGQLLYNNAVNSGDTQLALDILADYQQMGRSAARALQAMSIMQKLTPDNRLYMIRRSVRNMVDALGTDVKITIPAELEQQYLAAQSDAEANAVLDEIAKNVAAQIPSTLPKILTTLRYTNMLFNLKTQVRNVVGNAGMYGVSGVKNAVATALQRMSNKAENTRSLIVDPAYRKAGKDDFKNVERIVLRDGKYQEGSVEADDFKRNVENAVGVNQTGNRFIDIMLTPLQKANTATQWMMNNTVFGDYAFARGNYARALGGYLKAQGITPEQWSDAKWQEDNKAAVRKAREFAIKDAQENTFRDSNKLSDWISRIGRRENTPKAVRALSEGLAPFRRTPANILLRAEEYSPLGIFNTAVKAAQSANGSEEVTANDVTEQLAKTLTGTGLFLLGMLGAMRGVLRGAEDDDEQQAAFDDLRGHQPYSIEIGDKSYTLDWLTPASMPLFMGVELANGLAENGLTISDIESALTSIAEPMLEMSMMSGAKDALDNIQYSDNNLIQLALNLGVSYLTQIFTSTLGGQIERTFEPNRMTTYVDKNKGMSSWMQYALGKASAKGIGEYGQTEYIDAWGRTESSGNFGQRAFNNFLAPWYSSTVSNDPLEAEIQRLYNATGENVFPERPEKYFTVDGERVDLTAEQYTEYATKRGNELYNLMQKVVDSSAYKKASDSGKSEMLTDAKDYATKTAKASVSDYKPDGWVAKAKNTGIAPEKYIAVLSQLDKVNEGSDSITQTEAQKALDATGLSRTEKAKMWNNINKQWKSNPYK